MSGHERYNEQVRLGLLTQFASQDGRPILLSPIVDCQIYRLGRDIGVWRRVYGSIVHGQEKPAREE